MTAADDHSLSGPYALDALPSDERGQFERHLRTCASCREEVEEFRATAARLADATVTAPPPELRERVLAEAARTRQVPPPVADEVPAKRAPSWRRRVLAAAAAVVFLAGAGVTGVQIQAAREASEQGEQVAAILAAPDSRTVRGAVAGGGRVTLVVSPREDAAFVVLDRLPVPPTDRTYQLWFIHGTTARSAGTVDMSAPGRATRILHSAVAGADGFGLTVEPRGGSRTPTPPVIAQLPLG